MNFLLALSLSLGLLAASPVFGQSITDRLTAMEGNFKSIPPLTKLVIGITGSLNIVPLIDIKTEISSAKSQQDNLPSKLLLNILNWAAIESQLNKTVASHNVALRRISATLESKIDAFNAEASTDLALANQILRFASDNLAEMFLNITFPLQERLYNWSTGLLPALSSIPTVINEYRQSLLQLSIKPLIQQLCFVQLREDLMIDRETRYRSTIATINIGKELEKIINKQTCQGTLCENTLIPLAIRLKKASLCDPSIHSKTVNCSHRR